MCKVYKLIRIAHGQFLLMENVKCFGKCADVMVYCIGSDHTVPNVKDPVIEVCNTTDRLYLYLHFLDFSSLARTLVGSLVD